MAQSGECVIMPDNNKTATIHNKALTKRSYVRAVKTNKKITQMRVGLAQEGFRTHYLYISSVYHTYVIKIEQ